MTQKAKSQSSLGRDEECMHGIESEQFLEVMFFCLFGRFSFPCNFKRSFANYEGSNWCMALSREALQIPVGILQTV